MRTELPDARDSLGEHLTGGDRALAVARPGRVVLAAVPTIAMAQAGVDGAAASVRSGAPPTATTLGVCLAVAAAYAVLRRRWRRVDRPPASLLASIAAMAHARAAEAPALDARSGAGSMPTGAKTQAIDDLDWPLDPASPTRRNSAGGGRFSSS